MGPCWCIRSLLAATVRAAKSPLSQHEGLCKYTKFSFKNISTKVIWNLYSTDVSILTWNFWGGSPGSVLKTIPPRTFLKSYSNKLSSFFCNSVSCLNENVVNKIWPFYLEFLKHNTLDFRNTLWFHSSLDLERITETLKHILLKYEICIKCQ